MIQPPLPEFLPHRVPAALWRPASSRLLLGAAAVLTLAACSVGLAQPEADRTAWPPYGGSMPVQPDAPAAGWGVPAFDPPSATHCRGPQRLSEQPGLPPNASQGNATGAWGRSERAARGDVRDGLAERRRGVVEAEVSMDSAAKSLRDPASPATAAAPATPSLAKRAAPAGAAADAVRSEFMPRQSAPTQRPQVSPIVTAGMVDDNADFTEYLAYRQRSAQAGVQTWDRDIGERYRVEVRDATGRVVPDAEVALTWPGASDSVAWARTDAGGSAWLHPRAILSPDVAARVNALEVQVRQGSQFGRTALLRGQKHGVQVRLGAMAQTPTQARLDLVFLVDATGSMGDEIHKLKTSLRDIANQIAALPSRPDLCFALVAYRDHGDAFLTRTLDFTDRLDGFQATLNRLQADGGGDTPEALNEALHEVVHGLSWRGDGATRMVVLVADAPPHLDGTRVMLGEPARHELSTRHPVRRPVVVRPEGVPQYDADTAAALAKGIKLFAVGASGLDPQGEAVFRQMAQYTGGRFVFLTYRDARRPSSGAGTDTVHDVSNYSVDTLDRLIVKLVREELARRPAA